MGTVRVKLYAVPVAAIGAAISIYHYQLEMFPEQSSGVCAVDVPCTVRWFEVFGFISLAFMALTGFLAVIALLSIARPRPDDDHTDADADADADAAIAREDAATTDELAV
jgi:hypothetical protein